MTQQDAILNHLQSGQSLTPLDALKLYGCFRLSGRILELRQQGYDIRTDTERNGRKAYARYWLAHDMFPRPDNNAPRPAA